VPVLIKNFRDIDGGSPNSGNEIDFETSRLVHRFFIYDTISGIKKGYVENLSPRKNVSPKYVRFASAVKVTVQMDPSSQEKIRKPMLTIDYSEYES